MRPVTIRLEGFSAYRGEETVDLDGVEFFSLTGATGSGKSSLVDAMVFALFGRVPRLGGNAVAPAITAGVDRAKVAFDFEVAGERYTAVRLAERTRGGATVKEARLQRGATVLANGADQVSGAVEELLHLRFDDFTRTVVLPQGEFARFLTATKAERQALLRNLLGLDVYGEVRQLARSREAVASERAGNARSRLEGLGLEGEDRRPLLKQRLAVLEELGVEVSDAEDELSTLEETKRREGETISAMEDQLERLASIRPPEGLEDLHADLDAAREASDEAKSALLRLENELAELETRRGALPSRETIGMLRASHAELAELTVQISELDLDLVRRGLEEAESEVLSARERLEGTLEAREGARLTHSAHTLASTLVVGEPCPVCRQEVASLPESAAPPELTRLEAAVKEAKDRLEAAARDRDQARTELDRLETRHSGLVERRDRIARELADSPTLDELDALERAIDDIDARISELLASKESCEKALREARERVESLTESVRGVDRALLEAQREVAALDPPLPDSDDPLVRWKELLTWRDETLIEIQARVPSARSRLADLETRIRGLQDLMVERLSEAGVKPDQPYLVGLAREMENVRHQISVQEDLMRQAEELETTIRTAESEAAVAHGLAGHLRADGFERWLMAGAISGLVDGANELLNQLSSGGYSLRTDDEGSFDIVDHRNADETRSVTTLSGGETFLVSLALALSLAETLSAGGGAGLDSIILDEGFGTLDDEALDTVASVLEELAGRGLMVGVITHVKELAARAPVRFEVTRGPAGATVKRLS